MIYNTVGKINDNLYISGLVACPVFLLDAPKPLLFEGGTTCAANIYTKAIRSILGKRQPAMIFLTHVHWDHCGAVSYLKEAFPELRIAASHRAAQILKNQNALQLIKRLNEDARENIGAFPEVDQSQLINNSFQPFEVDIELEDGQILDWGEGKTIEVLATPGHTRDHLSYYLPNEKILIAGEASGEIDSDGTAVNQFVSDYEAYMASLRRLAALPVEVLCLGHQFVFAGREEVRVFFNRSISEAIRYKNRIYQLLDEEDGSTERVIQRVKEEYYDTIQGVKQPEVPYLLNLSAQVNHLAAKIT